MKIIKITLLTVILSFFTQKILADDLSHVIGYWLSENKKQKVYVFYSPTLKKFYGRIDYMYEDDQKEGRIMLDSKNPNPKLRTRRITGINLLLDFIYEGKGKFRGYIYDPVSGKNYRCLLTLLPDGKTAEIRGYIFHPWIGRTEIATKVDK